MDVQILNFVNIKRGHIVPATAPGDDPQWIEITVDGTHLIISKDLDRILSVCWYSERPDLTKGVPSGTEVLENGSYERYQEQIPEVARLVAKECEKLG